MINERLIFDTSSFGETMRDRYVCCVVQSDLGLKWYALELLKVEEWASVYSTIP